MCFYSRSVNIEPRLTNYVLNNLTNTTKYEETLQKRYDIINFYTILTLVATVVAFVRAFFNFYFCLKASKNLHKSITHTVLNSFMTFFDSHFIGNIVNRFSKDLANIDEYIPYIIYENLRCILTFLGIMYLIASVNVMFLIPAGLLILKLYFVRRFYLPTGRSIKRLDSSTRSPMIGYLNATLEGLTTIRAYEKQTLLVNEFDKHQDLYTSAYYMMTCTIRAFGFALDMICCTFIAVIVLKLLFFNNDTEAGDVGLAISQAMMLTGLLQWTIRQMSELENNMTSVERVLEYADVKTEDKEIGQVKENWPDRGKIEYKNVSLTYSTTKELVLKKISFVVESRQKIGIVGRTGAGKSSIMKTKRHISILGSIRSNIDPTNKYSDAVIWEAIEKVNLKHIIISLHEQIHEGGSNYSSGQRQLICLARALVSKNRIIILDEATASMDPETCALLQNTIKDNFSDCTVITIAHRLNTISNSDKVMVIHAGQIVEYETPDVLLENKKGVFYNMIKQAGLLET
ncbi:hypothetical protein NQ314_018111 [Rhamnusium bicolor]|uniref:Multidrug resistance-associated protein lethal(2)03659 n=1 Tax=Rhamnusium bicolor TaxID=1586634 RepID=A0AAV8WST2_9CUCU|nr:hypothetical protein NQ314_018111 [Rhamnusium bicolor]